MNIVKAIKHIRPNSQWVCNGSYESLVWLEINNDTKPTMQELESAWDEIKNLDLWEQPRLKRNRLLLESDWTQLSDSSVDKLAWANYRQILRDIPQNFQNPENIVWPNKPE